MFYVLRTKNIICQHYRYSNKKDFTSKCAILEEKLHNIEYAAAFMPRPLSSGLDKIKMGSLDFKLPPTVFLQAIGNRRLSCSVCTTLKMAVFSECLPHMCSAPF